MDGDDGFLPPMDSFGGFEGKSAINARNRALSSGRSPMNTQSPKRDFVRLQVSRKQNATAKPVCEAVTFLVLPRPLLQDRRD